MNRWLFGRVTDYFDNRTQNCIYRFSEEIGELSRNDQEQAYMEISQRIIDILEQVAKDGRMLVKITCAVFDDLYRSVNSATYFSDKQEAYLHATANVFFQYISSRGLTAHYASNNTYANIEAPTMLFPLFFSACGVVYIEPRHIALQLMQHDGFDKSMLLEKYAEYQREALVIVDRIVKKANEENVHYALILSGHGGNSFDRMLETVEKKGFLNFFKEADTNSSQVRQFSYVL